MDRHSREIAYLDHAATTPMRPEAVAAMLPFFSDTYGNPSGSHAVARAAQRALDDAREELASLLGASAPEIVFTSGGTEADNLAVLGGFAATWSPSAAGTVLCSRASRRARVVSRGWREDHRRRSPRCDRSRRPRREP